MGVKGWPGLAVGPDLDVATVGRFCASRCLPTLAKEVRPGLTMEANLIKDLGEDPTCVIWG